MQDALRVCPPPTAVVMCLGEQVARQVDGARDGGGRVEVVEARRPIVAKLDRVGARAGRRARELEGVAHHPNVGRVRRPLPRDHQIFRVGQDSLHVLHLDTWRHLTSSNIIEHRM